MLKWNRRVLTVALVIRLYIEKYKFSQKGVYSKQDSLLLNLCTIEEIHRGLNEHQLQALQVESSPTYPIYTMPMPAMREVPESRWFARRWKQVLRYLEEQYSIPGHTDPGRMRPFHPEAVKCGCSTLLAAQHCLVTLALACTVTARAPREQMAMTLENTPRDWDGGA